MFDCIFNTNHRLRTPSPSPSPSPSIYSYYMICDGFFIVTIDCFVCLWLDCCFYGMEIIMEIVEKNQPILLKRPLHNTMHIYKLLIKLTDWLVRSTAPFQKLLFYIQQFEIALVYSFCHYQICVYKKYEQPQPKKMEIWNSNLYRMCIFSLLIVDFYRYAFTLFAYA